MIKLNDQYYLNNTDKDVEQYLYRFSNGYGASVIRSKYSYGGQAGLYELAVIRWDEKGDNWALCYTARSITRDVEGWLTEEQVNNLLHKIKLLRKSAVSFDEFKLRKNRPSIKNS